MEYWLHLTILASPSNRLSIVWLTSNKIRKGDLMPIDGDKSYSNLHTGELHLSGKARERALTHAHHDYDVEAMMYAWNNPRKLAFRRISPMGEVKDMTDPKAIANIEKKKKRHVIGYVEYELKHNGRIFIVKLEQQLDFNKEQFYSIIEK